MQWSDSELAMLAYPACRSCLGTGARATRKGAPVACGCSLRSIFRSCYARFQECALRGKHTSQISFERNPRGRGQRGVWSRKDEEYIADFELLSRRALDAVHYKIFRYHFLLGADWKLCCRRLGISRGNFFHAVYRIEERLGMVFRQTEPYGLYPPSDYFQTRRTERGPAPPQPPVHLIGQSTDRRGPPTAGSYGSMHFLTGS
jgi:hypothetical protein